MDKPGSIITIFCFTLFALVTGVDTLARQSNAIATASTDKPLANSIVKPMYAHYQTIPTYPINALAKRVEGYCDVQFNVSSNGLVTHAKVLHKQCANSAFAAASKAAIKEFVFSPQTINGEAKPVAGIIRRFHFSLNEVAVLDSF